MMVEYKLIMNLADKLKEAGGSPEDCYLVYHDSNWYLIDKKDFKRNNHA